MSRFEWIEKSLGFLFNLFLYIVILLFHSEGNEPRQILEGICEDDRQDIVQSGRGAPSRAEGEDTVDFLPTSDQKKSLEKVSEAIYRKFILIWHSPPETLQNQPLYKEINSGLEKVFYNIKSRMRPLEEYEIIISVATRLIAHFQNKKNKTVTYSRFRTRQEEVDFIRKHTERLLDYWLPESMMRSRLLYVFITEILSVNVLDQAINSFSEPTFINDAIVLLLEDNPAAQQKKVSGRSDKKNQGSGCCVQDETNTNSICSNGPHDQSGPSTEALQGTVEKKKKGLKKLTALVKRKLKKTKPKSVLGYRSLQYDGDVADMGYGDNEGSDDDNEGPDDDNEGPDGENEGPDDDNEGPDDGNEGPDDDNEGPDDDNEGSYDGSEDGSTSSISIIDATLQKWQQNNWTAKVSENLVEKEVEYVIAVYDESAPDTVLWDIKRRAEDFKLIYETICQKYHYFSNSPKSNATGGPISDGRPFFHSIRTTPDKFINILLDLIKVHQDTEAVFFFLPFDYEDDIKELLKDIQCSEEEHSSEQSTTDDESSGDSSNSGKNHDCPKIAFRSFHEENSEEESNEDKSASRNKKEDNPSTGARSDEPPNNLDVTSLNPQMLGQRGVDVMDQNITQTQEQRKQKLQKDALTAIYQLAEVLLGGVVKHLVRIDRIMKTYDKCILSHIPDMYAEKQIIWYLDQVAELLTSELRPQELRPPQLQDKALDVLKNKVRGFLPNFILKYFLEERIMKNLKASHQALQDPLANKETLYGLLEDLTKIITNDHH